NRAVPTDERGGDRDMIALAIFGHTSNTNADSLGITIRLLLHLAIVLVCILNGAMADEATRLPNTEPLTLEGDLSSMMHEAAHRDMERMIAFAPRERARFWNRNTTTPEAYDRSIDPNRRRFREIIGLVDSRAPVTMERFGDDDNPALVAETKRFRA